MTSKVEIINKIIELTKQEKLEWFYLNDAPTLCNQLRVKENLGTELSKIAIQIENSIPFDSSNSFYTILNGNYIVLLASTETKKILRDRLSLMLVTKTYRDKNVFTDMEEILQLHTLVKGRFPSVNDIINDLFAL